jgi:ABC-type uncharacterized transport system substrate-binding protein
LEELAAGKGRAVTTTNRIAFAVAGLLAVAGTGPAAAHPHVFVDARAEIVFDKAGEITAIRHIWQFDEAFTAFAIQGLDADNDGKLSDAELKPLAKVNVDSLKEYGFFTTLRQGRKSFPVVQPSEYWLEFHGGRLTLFYTLPLKKPVAIHGKATLEVFDPEYFVAFAFPKNKAVTLAGAPAGCTAEYHPPKELDADTMATLAASPADQHDLPPELQDAAAGLANMIALDCPGEPGSSGAELPSSAGAPVDAVMAGADGKPFADIPAPLAAPAAEVPPSVAVAAPPAQPAPPTLVIASNDGGASVSSLPAPPPPAADETATTAESGISDMVVVGLAVVLAGGIAVAGFFLQRNLRRSR